MPRPAGAYGASGIDVLLAKLDVKRSLTVPLPYGLAKWIFAILYIYRDKIRIVVGIIISRESDLFSLQQIFQRIILFYQFDRCL